MKLHAKITLINFDELERRALALSSTPGPDLHRVAAAEMFGVPYEQVTPEQRQAAKERGHALSYGATSPTGRAR